MRTVFFLEWRYKIKMKEQNGSPCLSVFDNSLVFYYIYTMTKLKTWVHAFRLRTLPLSFSGIILGSFIAYSHSLFDSCIFGFAMLTTVLFQVLSNLANDLGDTLKGADNMERVGPERAVQSGKITVNEMKRAVGIFGLLSFCSASVLIYLSSSGKPSAFWIIYGGLAALCILAAITYTIGKKAYGYLGLGDFFVFIFFGLVSVIGVYYLYVPGVVLEQGTIYWELLLPASIIGFLSAAVLNLNNMRDRVNDQKVGKKTLVVKIGGDVAKLYHSVLVLAAILCMFFYVKNYYPSNKWMYLLAVPGLVLILHLRKVMGIRYEKDFDPELKKVALSAFSASILFALAVYLKGEI